MDLQREYRNMLPPVAPAGQPRRHVEAKTTFVCQPSN
jgi:hypothetical protein